MGVGDKLRQEVDGEIGRTAVAGMLDLHDVFELIGDGLNQETFTQEEPIRKPHQLAFHVLAQGSDEFEPVLPQPFKKRLGEVAFVTEELTDEILAHSFQRSTVIGVARSQVNRQQLTSIIDNEMELEAVKPTHCRLAPRG